MRIFKRLFAPRQKDISPDDLARNIHGFSQLLRPRLWRSPLGMIETIQRADEEGVVLLPNNELSKFLGGKVQNAGSDYVWSGTLIIFEENGRAFNGKVECALGMVEPVSLSFEVPAQDSRREGGCFAINHPYFRMAPIEGNGFALQASKDKLQYVKGFPVREGRFSIEGFFGLPFEGGEVSNESIQLSIRPFAFIGLVGRSFSDKERMFTTDPPDNKMCAMVRPLVDPQNYVRQVISILRTENERRLTEYAYRWAKEDPNLANALGRM